jgi:hypothetical protein
MTWLMFALVTVVAFWVYGNLLHLGQLGMADPNLGRYKAFLFVGVAYFLTAVLWPLIILLTQGASWSFPVKGAGWSLAAGIAGAVGAFCILLAFGAKGTPAVVMSIVFGGAPIVNAIASMAIHPPAGGFSSLRWQFITGILLAALGGGLVTLYKPDAAPSPGAGIHKSDLKAGTVQSGGRAPGHS